MRLHQCEWSCVRIIRPTTSLSRQGEKKDDTSWYFQMNLAFRSYHPAAGEEDGENILRRSLCRRLIFYFSDIPTSEDTVIPGCHGVMKSALDQWLHNKDGGGGEQESPCSTPWPFQGSSLGRAQAPGISEHVPGHKGTGSWASHSVGSPEPLEKWRQTGFRRVHFCVVFKTSTRQFILFGHLGGALDAVIRAQIFLLVKS